MISASVLDCDTLHCVPHGPACVPGEAPSNPPSHDKARCLPRACHRDGLPRKSPAIELKAHLGHALELMGHRTVMIRLADGDAAGVRAIIRIRHGEKFSAEVTLDWGKPSATFAYDFDAEAAGTEDRAAGSCYFYEVEYQWGYAREAWHKGESDAGELILPFPGSTGNASFPFPRR